MKPYFNNDERVAKLLYHANLWIGTPWTANSEVRGFGVSCHNLPRAIYIECGALKDTFPKVIGDPNGTKHSKNSIIEPFLNDRPEFARVAIYELRPGDLVGLRIRRCIDHLGVVLSENWFIHVLFHKKTDCDQVIMPPWSQRALAAWRPVE